MKQLMLTVLIAALTVGCGPSTEIVKSWQEPNTILQANTTNKTLVIAMVKDETSRRVIEDQLAKRMNANAVASYTFVTAAMLKEASGEKFTEKLKQDKYNYVLLMRLADVEKETSYVPGTTTGYYGGYGRYYGYGAGMYSSPGYYTTDKNYFIETTVYSVDPDKLLWTGTTKTVNPAKIEKSVNEIADVVTAKMRKDKFLK
ncbi:MAG TPA: hypothetical protein VFV68_11435 [Agriterribacter sp.]|nr:hypothetical protein [Agriterribacter sp.]